MTGETLHTKYRPTALHEVIGQEHIMAGLRTVIHDAVQQAFILEGPSGCGKTTIARIMAKDLGCTEVIEIDAASHTGVDAMREISNRANFTSLDGGGKAFIVDECHRMSKQAWESLLKDIEEPPVGVFWIFCTTEGHKIVKTIRTRCVSFTLHSVAYKPLLRLLAQVATAEGLDVSDDVLDAAADAADGSPRQALINLTAVSGSESASAANDILSRAPAGKVAFDFARMICKQTYDFGDACVMLKTMKDAQPENIRHTVRAYATTVVLNDASNRWARGVLLAFEKPCIDMNQISDIVCRLITLEKWKGK